jgi:ketosteroid isomerase-like protein
MPIDETALQQMLDERAIRRLVARYSDAVSRRDEADWAATWSDEAVWDVGIAKATGREAIVETWKRLMGSFRFVSQLPQSGLVEVTGDEATGVWHFLELGWPAEGPGTVTLGHYRDVYERSPTGAWRFRSRVFRIVYMGPGDLSGHVLGHPDAPL